MRSNAPLINGLLEEKADSDYSVAIEDTGTRRKLATVIGVASSLLAFVSLLETIKLTK